MSWLWLLLIGVIIYLLWRVRAPSPDPHLVEPEGRQWYIGHTLVAIKRYHANDYFDWMVELHKKYQRTHWYAVWNEPRVINLYPTQRNGEHLLHDNFKNYPKPQFRLDTMAELFGGGIFGSNGDAWMVQRKAASHLFTAKELKGHITRICVEHGHTVLKRLTTAAIEPNGMDVQALFFQHTFDTFGAVAFGEDMGCLAGGGSEFSRCFDAAQNTCMFRYFDPLWKLKKLCNIGTEKQMKRDVATLNRLVYALIARRRADMASANPRDAERADLVSHYLRASKRAGHEPTDEQLRDLMVNFLVAGRDTTACALSWFFYELARNPVVEAKVIEEVDQMMARYGDDVTAGSATFEMAQSMAYTEQVLFETLRLHPSVPADDVEALADDTFPDGTRVKKGDSIFYSAYVWNRCESLWPNALTFDPSRWATIRDDDEDTRKLQYRFITFNGGPRVCLGKSLALLEAKLLICMILNRYTLRYAQKDFNAVPNFSIVMTIKGGLPMIAVPRPQPINVTVGGG